MVNKRELGQYFTCENPFSHELFQEWMKEIDESNVFLEPFAGSNNILKLVLDSGYNVKWKCYDIDTSHENVMKDFPVEYRDTILNFPSEFNVCITNPPYLGKSSARRRHITYEWKEDDLYKVCLRLMLDNCGYVAAIIPESFITANIHLNRLWGIISLTCKMFSDTDCPVCLALFTPNGSDSIKVYSWDKYLGTLQELQNIDLTGNTRYHNWVFNDKEGTIGVKTVDNQKCDDCKFFDGELIKPESIKVSSRAFTRISGLPEDIDKIEFLNLCNNLLKEYREETKDVLMTSFKGLRSDGKYRRRLDFKTVRCILNKALKELDNKPQ